jgi:phosphoglycolate phosphatase-like HAD superfamily hydrolase
MKDNTIILDLDETLVSTHVRQYSCIHNYISNAGKQFIDFNDYFELRRRHGLTNTKLLEYLAIDLDWDHFRSYYLDNIESQEYLLFDKLIVEKHLLVKAVEKGYKLVLVSLRSNHENSKKQLQNIGIADFFDSIYFEHHNTQSNPKLSRIKELSAGHTIISFCGDSAADYEVAELLNINFVQVKTSLYNLPDFEHARQFININQYFLSIL